MIALFIRHWRPFLILASTLLAAGCLIPEQFEASLRFRKDGLFEFKYDGILTHALLRQAILAGGVDNKNDPDILKAEKELLQDPRFKKADYIGNGQFKVLCEISGHLDQPFYFLSKDLMILSIVPTSSDEVEVSSFAITEKSRQELAGLKISINGSLNISTDATVLSHNAKSAGLLGTYSWQITPIQDQAPSMRLRLSRIASSVTQRNSDFRTDLNHQNACINNLRQIDGAKEQWALEKRKRAGASAVESEIDEYIKGGHPKCPSGGSYVYNVIDSPPTCSIRSHDLGKVPVTPSIPAQKNFETPRLSDPIAQRNACINNLRQIDGAKEQWALEKRKRNGDQSVVNEVNEYIIGGQPQCPAGGKYLYNPIGRNPTCTVASHQL